MDGWLEVVEGAAALVIGVRVFASGIESKAASRRAVLIAVAVLFVLVGLLLISDVHALDTPAGIRR